MRVIEDEGTSGHFQWGKRGCLKEKPGFAMEKAMFFNGKSMSFSGSQWKKRAEDAWNMPREAWHMGCAQGLRKALPADPGPLLAHALRALSGGASEGQHQQCPWGGEGANAKLNEQMFI